MKKSSLILVLILFIAISGFAQEIELVVSAGHQNGIVTIAYHPNYDVYISAGYGGEVIIWDYSTLREVQRFYVERKTSATNIISEIVPYSNGMKVPELAEDIGGIQKPEIRVPSGGESFDIGLLETNDKEKIRLPSPKPLFVRSSFQNQQSFADNLELSDGINEELRSLLEDEKTPIVFVDASKFSNAYSLRGAYKQKGTKIQVQANLLKNDKVVQSMKVKGVSSEEVIKNLVNKVLGNLK